MIEYKTILNILTDNQLKFLLTGTWALKMVNPEKLETYQINDCDIVIENDVDQISKAINLLKTNKWQTTLWGENISEDISAKDLQGKYYIRARQQNLILDLTYEHDFYSWKELFDRRVKCDNYEMVAIDQILALKQIKGRPIDFKIISLLS